MKAGTGIAAPQHSGFKANFPDGFAIALKIPACPMSALLFENICRTVGREIAESELLAFRDLFSSQTLSKKEVLVREGERCRYTWFLQKGAAYSYYVNEAGEKNAVQFSIEGYWITDMYSFFSGRPALFHIETLEEIEALFLDRHRFEEACARFDFAERFFRILTQNAHAAQLYRIAKTNSETAEHRYLEFADRYPHFLARIPQYLIASYLGIAPQSLSRIRQQLATRRPDAPFSSPR